MVVVTAQAVLLLPTTVAAVLEAPPLPAWRPRPRRRWTFWPSSTRSLLLLLLLLRPRLQRRRTGPSRRLRRHRRRRRWASGPPPVRRHPSLLPKGLRAKPTRAKTTKSTTKTTTTTTTLTRTLPPRRRRLLRDCGRGRRRRRPRRPMPRLRTGRPQQGRSRRARAEGTCKLPSAVGSGVRTSHYSYIARMPEEEERNAMPDTTLYQCVF
jgi:hypothetical protein